MTSPDPPAAALLAQIRERNAKTGGGYSSNPGDYIRSAEDVPRLLAAVERVLNLHAPYSTVTRHICPVHATGMSGRAWASLKTYRDEVDACPDCRKEEVQVCSECRNACPDDDKWPCPTYRAITAALTGTQLSEDGEHER
jgi:hypothetical protein